MIAPLLGFTSLGIYQFNIQILFGLELIPIAIHSFLLSEESSGKKHKKIDILFCIQNNYIFLKNKKEMDEEFLNAKISSSMIYFSSVLPKIESLSSIILQGDEDVLSMKKNWL